MQTLVTIWANRLYRFDYFTNPDEMATKELYSDIVKANLSDDTKKDILRLVGYMSDTDHIKARRESPNLVRQPMWDEGAGPVLKRVIMSLLDISNVVQFTPRPAAKRFKFVMDDGAAYDVVARNMREACIAWAQFGRDPLEIAMVM
jgi:hypothetical protein